ncbi:Hsp20/alpha crystallin family protein [Microlunatus sp. Gsoil 973]|uniref:Hsp20/alpha crystallin family protein n=1 Tax=Microlunatus sp. Gsoil 973 TaxID=2672569 RepID=UPI0012B479F1|nr:Hsp20/alpha crystallin family protein [Microlunatus sp. Gsoil 973]QGN33509.1 Hsp20 family protein [Microlunatus sp. Gsoil 973]
MSIPSRRRSEELAAWNPWPDAPFFETPPLLDRRLGQLLSALRSGADRAAEFVPTGDLVEADNRYILDLDLPGVARSDVTVGVAGRRVVVRGTRKRPDRAGIVRHSGRLMGSFVYELNLPGPVDDKAVTARLIDGVLHVELPKSDRADRTRISID